MTNKDIICQLPIKDLAVMLIQRRFEEDWDYTYDENGDDVPFFWGCDTIYVTSDGQEFCDLDYEAALEHECWWLMQEGEKHA